jgi:hypothetical protein
VMRHDESAARILVDDDSGGASHRVGGVELARFDMRSLDRTWDLLAGT